MNPCQVVNEAETAIPKGADAFSLNIKYDYETRKLISLM